MKFKIKRISGKSIDFNEDAFQKDRREQKPFGWEAYTALEKKHNTGPREIEVEVNTLEEFIELLKKYDCEVILNTPGLDGSMSIEIYDDYRE